MKIKYLSLLLAAAISLSGCSSSKTNVISGNDAPATVEKPSLSAQEEESPYGRYTINKLTEMAKEGMHSSHVEQLSPEDMTDDAVIAYNNLINYAESTLSDTGFHIYDFCHYDYGKDSGYLIKIVLDEYKDSYDRRNAPVIISCREDGTRLKSQLSGFIYARKWTEALSDEIADKYPNYHLNTFYLAADDAVLFVDRSAETYNLYGIGIEPMEGSWSVNLILPPDTSKAEFKKAYDELKLLLKSYSVKELTVVCPEDKEKYNYLLDRETITNNCYYLYDAGNGWIDTFRPVSD